jgi:hypothetical protein
MIPSSSRRGAQPLTPRPLASPGDLAKRFIELQQLRKQVYELEHQAAIDRQQGTPDARTDEERHRK